MTTANELITDALEDIVAQADETPIEPVEAKVALRVFNQLMASLASDGINLGFTTISALGETLTIPDGAIIGVTSLLAYRLAPKYLTGEVPSTILTNAKSGYKILAKIGSLTPILSFPSTLPIGSGNTYPGVIERFYPDESSTILSEQNGTIGLEDSTEDDS